MTQLKKIGILGPWGSGNLGDAAIQEAVIHNLKKIISGSKIYGFTRDVKDTTKRHGLQCYDISNRRMQIKLTYPDKMNTDQFLKIFVRGLNLIIRIVELISNVFLQLKLILRAVRILRKFDMLIVSGGGQLDESWGGKWGHPFTIYNWSLAAKLSKTALIFLSVGVDTVNSRLGKYFLKKSLLRSDYCSFRDAESNAFITSLGVGKNNGIYPDLAYSYPVQAMKQTGQLPETKKLVGISPISSAAWKNESPAVYENYLTGLASFSRHLLSNDYNILFFPSQEQMDVPVVRKIESMLRDATTEQHIEYLYAHDCYDVDLLLSKIGMTDMVIASRLHAVLLSTLLCKPVIAISSQKKVVSLMQDLDLKAYIMSPDSVTMNTLSEAFRNLEERNRTIYTSLNQKIQEYRSRLTMQYEQIAPLLTSHSDRN
jgi:polysaccharide pyruvyl transferase WcaK-like protein